MSENKNLPAEQSFYEDFLNVKETYETTIIGIRKAMVKYTDKKCDAESLENFKNALKFLKDKNKAIKEQRTPITTLFDTFKKEFTAVEAEIKSDIDLIQSKLDEYATELEKERKAKELAILKENDAKRVESELQTAYSNHIQSECSRILLEVNTWFETLSLDQIEKLSDKELFFNYISEMSIVLPLKHAIVSTLNDVKKFTPKKDQIKDLSVWLNEQVSELAENLFEAIPDKKDELLEAVKSEEAAKAAKVAQELRLKEAKEAQAKADKEAKEKAAAIAATATLSAAISAAPVATAETVKETIKTKTTQVLTVLDLAGYDECYKYWRVNADFSKVGFSSLASVTLDRIAKFVEKNCNETGNFLQHASLTWTEQTKMK